MHTTELSNLSYTNKDFNSIYTELLEYAKKLSYKWDPSASDESDPGVVLLKLAALIGDKDSYNIDKNILELMPASVTQIPAARQVFDQCGYAMRYYRSAEGFVNLTIKSSLDKDDSEESSTTLYTVPMFTMFSDSDSTTVYTSTNEVTCSVRAEYSIPVIEGTITRYTINNDSLIRMQNLDSNNRLYFSESNIAENGIFITNVDKSNYKDWTRVDNLQIQKRGSLCYKFGLTLDNSICYIEFPEDIEMLIGEGLNISYILTSGASGNIAKDKLKAFYVDTQFVSSTGNLVDATTENIVIKNALPILNGQDPESIDDAYKNYKRVRDTFNTLVSLKDYTDYLVTSNTASNGYVCDRTNDIQRTYKVLTTVSNVTYPKTIVETTINDYYKKINNNGNEEYILEKTETPNMTAFDLCVYALEYVPVANTDTLLKKSFNLKDVSKNIDLGKPIFNESTSLEIESLQHNFLGFEENRILMIKNKYPVKVNIIPHHPLSTTEKIQVMYNVETALCNALNASQMSFGSPASIEVIQQAILSSDERVKTLIDFMSPRYETYAVYKDIAGNFKELRIDNDSYDGGYVALSSAQARNEFNKTTDRKSLFIKDANNNFSTASSTFDSSQTYYEFVEKLSNLWNDFRIEIFAKNVLAGNTPLYTSDNSFQFSIDQANVKEHNPITSIVTSTTIPIKENGGITVSDKLRENEYILLTAPNFVEENNFSSYVKFLYFLDTNKRNKAITAETKIELQENEFIMFFWKDSETSTDYSYIKYDSTSGSLAKYFATSNFSLPVIQDLTSTKYSAINRENVKELFNSMPVGKSSTSFYSSNDDRPLASNSNSTIISATEFVEKCLTNESKNQVLTGTKIITTYNKNKIHINNSKNGCRYVSWLLNHKSADGTYTLFDPKISGDKQYILKSGEYFLYTDDSKTTLHLLGEGTLLKYSGDNKLWKIPAVDYDTIIASGIDAVEWFTISIEESATPLYATEQQQILIGPGNEIHIDGYTWDDNSNKVIDSTTSLDLTGCTISYVDSKSNETKIPSINSESDGWSARALLSLKTSKNSPQCLNKGQSITLNSNETIGDSDENNEDYVLKYIQSNISLNIVDGVFIGDESSELSILSYDLVSMKTDNLSVESSVSNGSITLMFNEAQEGGSCTLSTNSILFGNYLLSIVTSQHIDGLSATLESENNVCTLTNISSNMYQLKCTSSSNELKLNLSWNSVSKNTQLTILPLYKYTTKLLDQLKHTKTDEQDKEISFENALLTKLEELDTNSIFTYIHDTPASIINPLISEEFLKDTHFYNPFTICEWDANVSSNVVIHDVIR